MSLILDLVLQNLHKYPGNSTYNELIKIFAVLYFVFLFSVSCFKWKASKSEAQTNEMRHSDSSLDDDFLSSAKNGLPPSSADKSDVRIIAFGRHIPHHDDERLGKCCTGTLYTTDKLCKYLREAHDIHNPKNGKRITDDWARRNLCMSQITHCTDNIDCLLDSECPRKSNSTTEQELCINAFEEALNKAGLKPSDIDGLLHNSMSLQNSTCVECLQFWYQKYEELKPQVNLHLSNGCPSFLHLLSIGKNLLINNPNMKNLAIVISFCSPAGFLTKDQLEKQFGTNDMLKWLGLLIFSDGAISIILSNEKNLQAPMSYKIVDVDFSIDPELNVAWTRKEKCDKGVMFDSWFLNMHAESLYANDFGVKFKAMQKKHGYSIKDFSHFAFHQANPRVVSKVAEYYGIREKTAVSGAKHGNLPGPSLASDLFERLMEAEVQDQDLILGYGMGASIGNTSGYFILQAEKDIYTATQI